METLYKPSALNEILQRLDKLTPESKPLWGKMNVAQMMAHCTQTLKSATGEDKLPRLFIGRILGPIAKKSYLSDQPFKKNNPTAKSFLVTDERDFNTEKKKLKSYIRKFSEGGEEQCTRHPHSFFGELTPEEWGTSMYKHLNHHLNQFGV